MLRFLFNMIIILLLGAVVFGSYLWYKRTPLLVRHLANELGVPVCADDVRIGWNHIEIKNLSVISPSGVVPYLFAAQSISVDLPYRSLLRHQIEVPRMVIDNCAISLELPTTAQAIWTKILGAATPQTPAASIQGNAVQYESRRRVTIDDLVINNLYVDLFDSSKKKQTSSTNIKRIELTNVGAGVGMPLGSAAQLILEQVISYLFKNTDLGKLTKGQPAPATRPTIPRGKYCYTPGSYTISTK
jgi:AsmA family